MQCLETILDLTFLQDPPSPHRLGKALRFHRAEALVFEETAGQAVRALANHYRAWRCEGLQPGGKVRGLTNHCLLLGGACSNEIANDDQTGRDANADLQRFVLRRKVSNSFHESKT